MFHQRDGAVFLCRPLDVSFLEALQNYIVVVEK